MQIDKDKLSKADPELLKEAVYKIAIAAGAGDLQARLLTRDTEKIKSMISGLTPEQIDSVAGAIGEDEMKRLLGQLNK